MKLYNTLTRSVEDFKPQSPPKVTLYSCGPTVYDYPHIGNWFTFIRYDVLVRTLKIAGYKPKWVMNITDVGHLVSDADEGEDKLEKGAKREGKSAWQVAEKYTEYFTEGLKRLNITSPDELPRATEHISEQIDFIKDLEKRGYTYVISDGVYYDTSKFADYGKLAKLDIKNLKEGARVEVNKEKRNPTDFALWKLSPKDQKRDMEWDSPWGKGFPGWHIECSAMSVKYLGQTLDIHAGGIDHIPVHHTNEIAQSEAVTGKQFANYWVHMNHITIDEEKIAKSKGNGILLEDLEKKGISLEAFRLLVLESNYRTLAEFNWNALAAAANRLKDIQSLADIKWQGHKDGKFNKEAIDKSRQAIQAAVENDLNTPVALANLSTITKVLETNGLGSESVDDFEEFIEWLDRLLGLGLSDRKNINDEQKQLISQREAVRQQKDWDEADKLRKELEKQSIGIRDTDLGSIWYRL